MIRALVPLGLLHVQELLDDEVTELAGVRHSAYRLHVGTNRQDTPNVGNRADSVR